MRAVLLAACALALTLGPGCIVWNSHLEPGVADFPHSLDGARHAPVRLNVEVWVPAPNDADPKGKKPWTVDAAQSERLAALINQAGICSEAATDLALAEGRLRVKLVEEPLGHPGLALLTACTVGVVPYFGGRRVTAGAELESSNGVARSSWTAVAEARLVGHLIFVAGWNLDALNDLRDDALRGVVVKLAAEQHRLTSVARPERRDVRTVTSR